MIQFNLYLYKCILYNSVEKKLRGSRVRKPNIAILGATGVVGREITKIVDELGVEFNEIKFFIKCKKCR